MSEGPSVPSFDTVDAAWVPVVGLDGTRGRVSLRAAFSNAHRIRSVSHSVPIFELGVWRLLIAIATDVLKPNRLRDVANVLSAGAFDAAVFDRYFDSWRSRFDLFHPATPFLQQAAAAGGLKPLSALSPLVPSGTNTTHWQKGSESRLWACPACATLLLTSFAPAMTAGGAGLSPSINGAPPYYCLVDGPSLFSQIVMNLWGLAPPSLKGGSPSWRSSRPLDTEHRRTETTLLEAYTWQPRSVRLLPDESHECSLCGERAPVAIRQAYFSKGESCAIEQWRDPNLAYVSNREKTSALRPRESRDAWRDVDALLLLPHHAGHARAVERPAIVSQFAELAAEGLSPASRMGLRLYGMRTDMKMKVFEWKSEALVLPVPIAPNQRRYEALVQAVGRADGCGRALASAITNATRRPSFDHRDLAKSLFIPAQRRYWSELEGAFHRLADSLATPGAVDGAQLIAAGDRWNAEVSTAAREAFDEAIDRLQGGARQLIATERARLGLDRYLARALASTSRHTGDTA